MSKKLRHRLAPNWMFPFRVLSDCKSVADSVWSWRWTRELSRKQKLARAQAFWKN